MKTYGLVGYPLGHSFSASFFNAKFSQEGIDACYVNYPMERVEHLRQLIAETPGLCGLNVTIPHKQQVIPLLDEVSPMATRIGAVNVISICREPADASFRLKGYNSDIIGFTQSLRPLLTRPHTQALVLGTGGAARAIIAGLQELGITPLCVSRRPQEEYCGTPVVTYADLTPSLLASHTIVVNCSPVGMSPKVDAAPDIPYEAFTSAHIAYDLIYNPEQTLFLQKAARQGALAKNGLEMLHRQALAAWDIWNAQP